MDNETFKIGDSVTFVSGSHKGANGVIKEIGDRFITVKGDYSQITTSADNITKITNYQKHSNQKCEYSNVNGAKFKKERITDKGYAIQRVFELANVPFGGVGKIFSDKNMTKNNYERLSKACDEIDAMSNDEKEYYRKKTKIGRPKKEAEQKENLKEEINMEAQEVKAQNYEQLQEKEHCEKNKWDDLYKEMKSNMDIVDFIHFASQVKNDVNKLELAFTGIK